MCVAKEDVNPDWARMSSAALIKRGIHGTRRPPQQFLP
jgi:hypothetical protein